MIAATPRDALRLIEAGAREGIEGVLVTLVGIVGTASRGVGTQIAVLADGRSVGSFSGGCVERAIVAEALEALRESAPRRVRYGLGSPYIDLRLPCGGGIDVLFSPRPDRALVCAALDRLAQRLPAELTLGAHCQRYAPPLRLVTIGHGEELVALVRLARAYGLEVAAFAPADGHGVAERAEGIVPLATPRALPAIAGDAWTAVVLMFHDRDWEGAVLPQVLDIPAFYHGAVGSLRTQQARLAALAAAGVSRERYETLRGPIGLIPGTRNPAALALSILAELVQDYEACAGQPGWSAQVQRAQ